MTADNSSISFPVPNTAETYSKIENMGLETVVWREFSKIKSLRTFLEIAGFIQNNKPCLFIYDPKSDNVKKGYLFNVKKFSEVFKWTFNNLKNWDKYNYLITTQISNHGFGFVGAAYSDGRGNLFCETLHKPGVCNQRELSQSENKMITSYVDYFIIDECQLTSLGGKFLSNSDIADIKRHYLDKKGYFEFVKGEQKDKVGIYTTGYEPFQDRISFPERLHRDMNFSELKFRLNARIIREI